MPERVRRALFVQYVNPAMYPPLEHSSRILANQGYEVRFLGVRERAASGILRFPTHPRIDARTMGAAQPGLRMKLHYLVYCLWCVWHAVTWRPTVVYASDLFATPVGVILSALGFRVIYHEHDWPSAGSSAFYRVCASARAHLLRSAAQVVVPNEDRVQWMAPKVPSVVVWNCPRLEEVSEPRSAFVGNLRILYQGSVNSTRVPLNLLRAMAAADARMDLDIVGYETVGSRGYVREFLKLAVDLGLPDRVHYHGPVPRCRLPEFWPICHLGLAITPKIAVDRNMTAMVGASNKFFDYLAGGLCPIVANLPEWCEFVDAGLAVSCDAESIPDLSRLIEWCGAHPEACHEIGERGRQRVLKEWNYETQFAPVVGALRAARSSAAR